MIEAKSTFTVIPEGVRLSLLPGNKVCEGHVFTGVCPRGGVSATLHTGIHPLGRHPPTQCMLGYTPPAQCMLGYGQQAGGTHPTGMHSCSEFMFVFYAK